MGKVTTVCTLIKHSFIIYSEKATPLTIIIITIIIIIIMPLEL